MASKLFAMVAIVLLGGCQTIRSGGAPEISFDLNADIQNLANEFQTATSISDFYKNPSVDARNRFLTGRLVLIDLRYLQFIRALTSDKQQIDAATDVATLTLNLAATLVGSAQAKTNLAAVAAALIGGKTIIDRDFYYEKSVTALVATMNARRKEVLTRIIESLDSNLAAYPFTEAVLETHQYYMAGTINGALTFIHSEAGQKEKLADEKLETIKIVRDVPLLTDDDRTAKRQLTRSVGAPDLTLAKANDTLRELGFEAHQLPTDLEKSKFALQLYIRQARTQEAIKAVADAFKKTGIFKTN